MSAEIGVSLFQRSIFSDGLTSCEGSRVNLNGYSLLGITAIVIGSLVASSCKSERFQLGRFIVKDEPFRPFGVRMSWNVVLESNGKVTEMFLGESATWRDKGTFIEVSVKDPSPLTNLMERRRMWDSSDIVLQWRKDGPDRLIWPVENYSVRPTTPVLVIFVRDTYFAEGG